MTKSKYENDEHAQQSAMHCDVEKQEMTRNKQNGHTNSLELLPLGDDGDGVRVARGGGLGIANHNVLHKIQPTKHQHQYH
jgi:hypothetical protein